MVVVFVTDVDGGLRWLFSEVIVPAPNRRRDDLVICVARVAADYSGLGPFGFNAPDCLELDFDWRALLYGRDSVSDS